MKHIVIFIIVAIGIISYFAEATLEDKKALCKDNGGIVVKTNNGYKCMSSGSIL